MPHLQRLQHRVEEHRVDAVAVAEVGVHHRRGFRHQHSAEVSLPASFECVAVRGGHAAHHPQRLAALLRSFQRRLTGALIDTARGEPVRGRQARVRIALVESHALEVDVVGELRGVRLIERVEELDLDHQVVGVEILLSDQLRERDVQPVRGDGAVGRVGLGPHQRHRRILLALVQPERLVGRVHRDGDLVAEPAAQQPHRLQGELGLARTKHPHAVGVGPVRQVVRGEYRGGPQSVVGRHVGTASRHAFGRLDLRAQAAPADALLRGGREHLAEALQHLGLHRLGRNAVTVRVQHRLGHPLGDLTQRVARGRPLERFLQLGHGRHQVQQIVQQVGEVRVPILQVPVPLLAGDRHDRGARHRDTVLAIELIGDDRFGDRLPIRVAQLRQTRCVVDLAGLQQVTQRPIGRSRLQDAPVFEHVAVQLVPVLGRGVPAVRRHGRVHGAAVHQRVNQVQPAFELAQIRFRRIFGQQTQQTRLRFLQHREQQLLGKRRLFGGTAETLLSLTLAALLLEQQLQRVEGGHLRHGAVGHSVRHPDVVVRRQHAQQVHDLFGRGGGARDLRTKTLRERLGRGGLRDQHLVHIPGQALVSRDCVDVAGRDRLGLGALPEQHVLDRVAGHQVTQPQVRDVPGVNTVVAGQFQHGRMHHGVQQRAVLGVRVQLHELHRGHLVERDGPALGIHQIPAVL